MQIHNTHTIMVDVCTLQENAIQFYTSDLRIWGLRYLTRDRHGRMLELYCGTN